MNKVIIFLITIVVSLHCMEGQTFYSQMAAKYADKGDYKKAIEIEEKGLISLQDSAKENSEEYAATLNNLSIYYACLEEFQKAIKLANEALVIFKRIYGEEHPYYTMMLDNLMSYNADMANFKEAARLGIKLKEIYKKTLGEKHPDYLECLYYVGKYNFELGDYEDAIQLITETLNIFVETLGKKNIEYPKLLIALATCYYKIEEYHKAIELETEALEKIKAIYGKKNPYYAKSLDNLSLYYYNLGNYQLAINFGTEALEIYKAKLGDRHSDYTKSLEKLARYNFSIGNFEVAIQLINQLLKIYKEISEDTSLDYAGILDELSVYYSILGNFISAIHVGTDALTIYKEKIGEKSQEYASTLHNLAGFYADLGNLREAIFLEKKSLEILHEILGDKDPIYASSLAGLASYLSEMGNLSEAIRLIKEAMEIFKLSLGERHPNYANSLLNLSVYYAQKGNYLEAISIGEKALQIQKEIIKEKHPDYADLLSNLANYNYKLGNYKDAINLVIEALEIQKEVLGEKHSDYTRSLKNLIAYDNIYLNKYSSIIISNIFYDVTRNFKYLPNTMRSNFWEKEKNWLEIWLPYYSYKTEQPDIINQSYEGLLLSKGILLNSEREFDQFIGETGDENLLEKYNEIKTLRLQLNKLYEKPIAERYCDTDSLERHVNELERKLMEESSEYGDYTKNLSVKWEDVQKELGKRDAAIEFVHFPLNQDSTMYMAYVLRPEMESPSIVKLFEEKDLSKLNDNNKYSKTTASNLIWGKLHSELEGVENVYFAPDGILHQMAIEYFPDFEDDEKLISDRYNLYRLSSTRQLALKKENPISDMAVIYGGIKYDTDTLTMANESRKFQHSESRGFQPWYNLADTLSLRSGVEYLKGTLAEATAINDMLRSKNKKSMLITDSIATEESFKNLSGQKNGILHIATHGFYWQEEEADKQAQLNDRLLFLSQFGDNARRNVEDKALTRTGLFMAGANNALSGKEIPDDIDDGILTASEIANLDLRGTDLVVLSACQTGMGDIGGDGVFGLQRGFKKAGVNTILMSLWDVDDAATGMFMTEFYRNLTSGKTKQESLKASQTKVRNFKGEINGEYRNFSNPRYWAAFILLDAMD